MKAEYLYTQEKRTGKMFMVLKLTGVEQDKLDQLGGFDKALDVTWIEELYLKGRVKFVDKGAYIFRGYLKGLDWIREALEKKLDSHCQIKNVVVTSTYEYMLAKRHSTKEVGGMDLYIDTRRPIENQRKGKLYATYRPEKNLRELFIQECRYWKPGIEIVLQTEEVVVVRGYQYGIENVRRSLKQVGFSCPINVQESTNYDLLLLLDSL